MTTCPSTAWGHVPPLGKECEEAKGSDTTFLEEEKKGNLLIEGRRVMLGDGNLTFHLEMLNLSAGGFHVQ